MSISIKMNSLAISLSQQNDNPSLVYLFNSSLYDFSQSINAILKKLNILYVIPTWLHITIKKIIAEYATKKIYSNSLNYSELLDIKAACIKKIIHILAESVLGNQYIF